MSAHWAPLLPCEDRNHGPAPLLRFLFPSPGTHYGSLSSRALGSGEEGEWGRGRKGGSAERLWVGQQEKRGVERQGRGEAGRSRRVPASHRRSLAERVPGSAQTHSAGRAVTRRRRHRLGPASLA